MRSLRFNPVALAENGANCRAARLHRQHCLPRRVHHALFGRFPRYRREQPHYTSRGRSIRFRFCPVARLNYLRYSMSDAALHDVVTSKRFQVVSVRMLLLTLLCEQQQMPGTYLKSSDISL
jgi:hypothetical protein